MRHILDYMRLYIAAERSIIKNPLGIHARGEHTVGSERKTIYYLSVRRVPDYAASAGTVTSAAITALFS